MKALPVRAIPVLRPVPVDREVQAAPAGPEVRAAQAGPEVPAAQEAPEADRAAPEADRVAPEEDRGVDPAGTVEPAVKSGKIKARMLPGESSFNYEPNP